MTFGEIKDNVRGNLNDAGVTFYSADDMSESLQDGYDDVAFQTHCILKKVSKNFSTSPYVDMTELIEDFMMVMAIFNNNTNRWLFDNFTVRDFDKIRNDWEIWSGTPIFWAFHNFEIVVILPYYSTIPSAQMDIYYAAQAPTIQADTESPLIATDFQDLLEHYVTADLLEQAEEYTKANEYWQLYVDRLPDYRSRVKRLAKRDLLLIG